MSLQLALRELGTLDPDPVVAANTLERLRFGWGNEKWSAEVPFLSAIAEALGQTRGTVIEAGSGLSTVLLCRLMNPSRTLLALEHEPQWIDRVNRTCGLRTPVVHSPLTSYGGFDWYEVPRDLSAGSVGLLVCDGPPSSTRGGRYGAIPLLREALSDDAVVLLDDAAREAETETLRKWEAEFGMQFERSVGAHRTYAIGRFR